MKKQIVVSGIAILFIVVGLNGCMEEEVVKNKAPAAGFTYSPTENIYVNTTIAFTDTSTDEDGTIASWSWDFGDNTTDDIVCLLPNPFHSYDAVGIYTVTLIVRDNDGNASAPYTEDISVS